MDIKTLLVAATALVLQFAPALEAKPLDANEECRDFGITIPQNGPILIRSHFGGEVTSMERCRNVLELLNREVRLQGWVFSSPTFILGLPTVCVEADALVGFHAARNMRNGTLYTDYSRVLASLYMPPQLANYYVANWNTQELHTVRGGQLESLGVSICT